MKCKMTGTSSAYSMCLILKLYLNKIFPLEKRTYPPPPLPGSAIPDWLTVADIVVIATIVFLISVILSGSEAALPDVGTCSFMEYFCDAIKCQTDFFKGLQKDPSGDCRYSKVCNSKKRQIYCF